MKKIAVASGKGGVGKSTVTTQLACLLAHNGYKVGIIDADVYGPSQYSLLNCANSQNQPNNTELELTTDNKIKPIFNTKHKIYYISVSNILNNSDNNQEPTMLWRAPIATKIIKDFIQQVAWPELDFLFIDMPPGTGDIQITIAQQANLDGAIIVTTPQKVAYQIAAKAINMFNKVNVNIIGIIENMSGYICTHCNNINHIFDHTHVNNHQSGGNILAEKYSAKLLGTIPLDSTLVELSDNGQSICEIQDFSDSHNEIRHPVKQAYFDIVENLILQLTSANKLQYKLLDNKTIEIFDINSSKLKTISAFSLRTNCPCAMCREELTGKKLLDINNISKDVSITNVQTIGNYGLRINFSDRHNTGIFTLDNIQNI